MKITHINNTDLPGSRFNGHDLQLDMNQNGHEAYQIVAEKLGHDEHTISLLKSEEHTIRKLFMEFEERLSMHSLIYPYGRKIMELREFREADVVHYHLIHNYLISLFDFEEMTTQKPSVWTLHDPWAFTGHCVYPLGCDKWKSGCHSCPQLDTIFPMKYDKAFQMWEIKKEVYSKLDLDIVVASKFMYDLVKSSPLTSHFERVHLIPFGIKLDKYNSIESKNISRKQWNIPEDHFVIAFRADRSKFKGYSYILEMLDKLVPNRKVTILTVGESGLLNKYKSKYNIIDFDWITDDLHMTQFYAACDVFLMPSTAEAFGLMAIEAMASSRPIIVFPDTSLPEVTFAPECGIVVEKGDTTGFCNVINELMNNPRECERRGRLGRQLAEKNYSYDVYYQKLMDLYKEVSKRKKK
ncbi:putative glycosyl transferase [Paenibacillus agaridevorans]|uniref:Putative glycosyl transferase n=1 Tax=Paenibacillus agaridevorans TaxID=171404 RepID=A0A2R5ESI0_9BACL|nr:glycosyltransferase [Paenibacillus agaridevorans]GBG07998.1 putative glycosyl transferase [Paenibacillus agaridevorans]